MARPDRRAPQRFRHSRSLRRHAEGRRAGVCPDATLVDIGHDIPAARRARRRARAGRLLPLLSRRHRSSWSSSIRASGRRAAALPPRPATTGSSRPTTACCRRCSDESPPKKRRRADRAQVRAARPSAARSKAAIASRRPPAGWPRASRWPRSARASRTSSRSICRAPSVHGDEVDRRGRARRSLRQPDHQHRSARRSSSWRSGGAIAVAVGGTRDAAPRRDLCRGAGRASCARSSAAPTTSRSRSTPATPPATLRLARGAPVDGAPVRRDRYDRLFALHEISQISSHHEITDNGI